jgi:hypothetical protein
MKLLCVLSVLVSSVAHHQNGFVVISDLADLVFLSDLKS